MGCHFFCFLKSIWLMSFVFIGIWLDIFLWWDQVAFTFDYSNGSSWRRGNGCLIDFYNPLFAFESINQVDWLIDWNLRPIRQINGGTLFSKFAIKSRKFDGFGLTDRRNWPPWWIGSHWPRLTRRKVLSFLFPLSSAAAAPEMARQWRSPPAPIDTDGSWCRSLTLSNG